MVLPGKLWIQSKQKRYKWATNNYSSRMRKSLLVDIESRLKKLRFRSPSKSFAIAGSEKGTPILYVDRDILPDVKLREIVNLINSSSKEKEADGQVMKISTTGVKIKLNRPINLSKEVKNYKIVYDTRDVLNRRKQIERAIRKFENIRPSLHLHKYLLGRYEDKSNLKNSRVRVLPNDKLDCLERSQLLAVEQSLKKRISLVDGATGCGKTRVAAETAFSMSRLKKKKILLCSPIQDTTDELTEMLLDYPITVVRLPADYNHISEESVSNRSLERLVKNYVYERAYRRLIRLAGYGACTDHKTLEGHANKSVSNCSPWLKRKLERKILHGADVVCCTLDQAASLCLRGIKFRMLIIDDVHLAPQIDCLVPMMTKGIKQVTLLSLEKTLEDSKGAEEVEQSTKFGELFERLKDIGIASFHLRQRRV